MNPSKPDYRLCNIYKEYFGVDIDDYESKEEDKAQNYGSTVKAIGELIDPINSKIIEMGLESFSMKLRFID